MPNLSSIRLPLIAGNWKMHMTGEEAQAYLARFLPALFLFTALPARR